MALLRRAPLSAAFLSCHHRHPEEDRAHKWQIDPFPPLPKAYLFRDTRRPAFQPLQDAEWRTVEQATCMRPTDLVLGLYLDWKSFAGQSFWGELRGSRLERLPLHHSTWAEWLALHPTTLVANGESESRKGHGQSFEAGEPGMPAEFVRSLERPFDPRLPAHVLVVGVATGACARAYPLSTLDRAGPVVNDTLCREPIALFHKPGSMFTSVLSRRHDDRLLAFEAGRQGQILDGSARSRWNYEGEALDGPWVGRQLAYVPWTIEEWYVWVATHPETEIYGASLSGAGR